jgi:hypothetical protein
MMVDKIKKWLLIISIVLFLLYGLIYHTYVILFFLLVIGGVGYTAVVWGKKIKDIFDDLK